MKKRLYIYCEGQTEEQFVNVLLTPLFANYGIITTPIICATKRTKTGKFAGGVSSFGKVKNELINLCASHPNELVTTLFDYYAFPYQDLIEYKDSIDETVSCLEHTIEREIGRNNLIFNFVIHEFEALLFSNPFAFAEIGASDEQIDELIAIKETYINPELINNSPETAPSKRIIGVISNYKKVYGGVTISSTIGITTIRRECPHFDNWINKVLSRFDVDSEQEI